MQTITPSNRKAQIKLIRNFKIKFLNTSINVPKNDLDYSNNSLKQPIRINKQENYVRKDNNKIKNQLNNKDNKEGNEIDKFNKGKRQHFYLKKNVKKIDIDLMYHRVEVEKKFIKSIINSNYIFPKTDQILEFDQNDDCESILTFPNTFSTLPSSTIESNEESSYHCKNISPLQLKNLQNLQNLQNFTQSKNTQYNTLRDQYNSSKNSDKLERYEKDENFEIPQSNDRNDKVEKFKRFEDLESVERSKQTEIDEENLGLHNQYLFIDSTEQSENIGKIGFQRNKRNTKNNKNIQNIQNIKNIRNYRKILNKTAIEDYKASTRALSPTLNQDFTGIEKNHPKNSQFILNCLNGNINDELTDSIKNKLINYATISISKEVVENRQQSNSVMSKYPKNHTHAPKNCISILKNCYEGRKIISRCRNRASKIRNESPFNHKINWESNIKDSKINKTIRRPESRAIGKLNKEQNENFYRSLVGIINDKSQGNHKAAINTDSIPSKSYIQPKSPVYKIEHKTNVLIHNMHIGDINNKIN